MKSAILDQLRKQLEPQTSLEERKKIVADRLKSKKRGVVPDFPRSSKALLERFIEHAEASAATVSVVSSNVLNEEIENFLRKHNLPMQLICGPDERLEKAKTSELIEYDEGPSDGSHLAGLSHAEMGIAETGTLSVLSGKENPTTNNFLPENHIVMVDEKDLAANYEDLWDRIRTKYGDNEMPRTVNLITGPSRSGDIEQKLILGAHGPVRLHIIVVKS